ncbi:MAG TPA: IPT/TIG domain-containing protein [Candidatus Dormibacteraeota bacterium]|nr:IPT/TIG domain-containing protein [Candidatus Dormibacteraeota bacterium]
MGDRAGRTRVGALAAAGVAALLGAGLSSVAAPGVRAASNLGVGCPTMTVTGVSSSSSGRQHGQIGSTVTVTGTNLDLNDYLLCSSTLAVSIGSIQFSVDTSKGSATSQSFTLGQRANGAVTVSSSGTGQGSAGGNLVFVTDPNVSNVPPSPAVGQGLAASGTGLNLGGLATGASVSWSTSHGVCPGGTASLAADGSSVSVPAFGSYCNGVGTLTISWTANRTGGASQSLTLPLGTVDVAALVSGSAPAEAPAGASVTVRGSGFGTSGSARVGAAAATSSWSDTAVTVTLPDAGVGGSITLTRVDGAAIGAGSVTEDARIDRVGPLPATAGATVTVTGGGFGPQGGSLALGSAQVSPASWAPTSISFLVPDGAATGSVIVTPSSGAAASARFVMAAILKAVSPTHGPPGTAFDITGTGFGSQTGTVSVGGRAVTVLLWGDGSIVASVPAGMPPGPTLITAQPPGENAVSAPFMIDAPPPPPAPAGSGGSASASGSASSSSSSRSEATPPTPAPPSFIAPSANGPIVTTAPVPFQKPPAPTGPVSLTLSSSADSSDPGKDVTLSVALVAFGKPVAGSQVDFLLVVEPGRDAGLQPASAVTDAAGHATTTLHLSSTAGDTIVLARSGQYSDEVRVVAGGGAGPVAALGGAGRGTDVIATITSGPPKAVIVGALVACLVLFLSGFAIQVVLPEARRRHAYAAAGVRGTGRPAATSRGGAVVNGLVDAGAIVVTVVQFGVVVAVAAVASVPAALLRASARAVRRR